MTQVCKLNEEKLLSGDEFFEVLSNEMRLYGFERVDERTFVKERKYSVGDLILIGSPVRKSRVEITFNVSDEKIMERRSNNIFMGYFAYIPKMLATDFESTLRAKFLPFIRRRPSFTSTVLVSNREISIDVLIRDDAVGKEVFTTSMRIPFKPGKESIRLNQMEYFSLRANTNVFSELFKGKFGEYMENVFLSPSNNVYNIYSFASEKSLPVLDIILTALKVLRGNIVIEYDADATSLFLKDDEKEVKLVNLTEKILANRVSVKNLVRAIKNWDFESVCSKINRANPRLSTTP